MPGTQPQVIKNSGPLSRTMEYQSDLHVHIDGRAPILAGTYTDTVVIEIAAP